MQPAAQDLTLESGDDARIRFLLVLASDASAIDLTGQTVGLELTWRGGAVTLTDGAGLTVDAAAGVVAWGVTAALSASLPLGRLTRYGLVLDSVADGRRTYLTGYLNLTDNSADGDSDVLVTVADLAITVAVTLGSSSASQVSFDDTLTILGVDNVQDAINALYELIAAGGLPGGGGQLDFSNPNNAGLGFILGVI